MSYSAEEDNGTNRLCGSDNGNNAYNKDSCEVNKLSTMLRN